MRSALYKTDTFIWILIVLVQQSANRHVAPLGHIIVIPSQPVFALSPEYCMLSGEATHTYFIVFGLTQPVLEPTINHTRGEHATCNYYTTAAFVFYRNMDIYQYEVIMIFISKAQLTRGSTNTKLQCKM